MVVQFGPSPQPLLVDDNVPNSVTRQSENQLFASTVFDTKADSGQEIISDPDQYRRLIGVVHDRQLSGMPIYR